MGNNTIEYYNQYVKQFVSATVDVDFKEMQDEFINKLPGKNVLDFGCGSGRDTKYFLNAGLTVAAIDGSVEMCKAASEYTGIQVRRMLFEELNEKDCYDGIWACSSILHLPKEILKRVFFKMTDALRLNGIIYTSFKYGNLEGERNGRYFTNFTIETFSNFIKEVPEIYIEEKWISTDVRPGRNEEKWLNLILRRKNS